MYSRSTKRKGLIVKEGVVIHFVGSKRLRLASKHGLAFVALTRSENFAMTAFKNLPPWQDFLEGHKSDMLRMRRAFTELLEELHAETLARHASLKTSEDENEAHEAPRILMLSDRRRQNL